MENIADALKIAAAVLIFVLALSISINAFGEARIASRTILEYKDKEYNYDYVEQGSNERIVGLESIIPTIYKAYKENYKIVFAENIFEDGVYKKQNGTGSEEIYKIDSEEVLGGDTQKEQFIMAILYGSSCMKEEKIINYYGEGFYWDDFKIRFQNNLGIYLNNEGIYDKIKNRKLIEKIGIYYQEEVASDDIGSIEENNNSNVPDANKTLKRVITYSLVT